MHATIWQDRIGILGAESLPKEKWEPLLDELKAEHVPSGTPAGKRHAIFLTPTGRTDAFVYRTTDMADEEIIRILGKYGIPASVSSENAASTQACSGPRSVVC
jgi:hypothetical protein